MKILLLALLILTCSLPSLAQTISVHHSVQIAGTAKKVAHASVEYKNISVHYFLNYNSNITRHREYRANGLSFDRITRSDQTSAIAIAYLPIQTRFFALGGMASKSGVPTKQSSRLNFVIELRVPVSNFRFSLMHISSGFGVLHRPNPGIDTVGLTYSF